LNVDGRTSFTKILLPLLLLEDIVESFGSLRQKTARGGKHTKAADVQKNNL
jgi:hypothetical protein